MYVPLPFLDGKSEDRQPRDGDLASSQGESTMHHAEERCIASCEQPALGGGATMTIRGPLAVAARSIMRGSAVCTTFRASGLSGERSSTGRHTSRRLPQCAGNPGGVRSLAGG